MSRVRSSLVLAMVFVLGAALVAAAAAQAAEGRAGGTRRRSGIMDWRASLVFLLNQEQVQKELKLNEEQTGKVTEISKKLMGEMREQWASLREITDQEKQWAKMAELSDQMNRKARTQLQDVISREQRGRLNQIRMQIRGPAYTLNSKRTASRLKLTDEQRKKLAEIDKDLQQKVSEAIKGSRDLSQEERGKRFAQLGKLRQKANQEALKLLTAEQKEGLEKMQGKKFELQRRRPGA